MRKDAEIAECVFFKFALGCKKGSKNFGKFWSIFSHG